MTRSKAWRSKDEARKRAEKLARQLIGELNGDSEALRMIAALARLMAKRSPSKRA